MSKEIENNTTEMAGLEAASDMSASSATEEVSTNLNDRLPYVVELTKQYDLEGQKIDKVDLSGLEDLTTADAEYMDRVMAKMDYHPKQKYQDITYTKHIAMRVTNLPIEFFNSLRWKDMQSISSRITIYFLY
ncbi:MAG: hypothetical protein E7273_13355 [Pseudobutyrivibrio ruminis]|nr:hypothetical protein [Pseudobutyrivibrio ruminis]